MKKNILIIVQHLYGGGAERAAADVAENLRKNNNVLLVTFADKSKASYQYDGEHICLGLKTDNIFLKIFVLLRKVIRLKRIKRERKIDFSISFLSNANLVNVLSNCGEKDIVSIRNNIEVNGKKYRVLEKIICDKSDKVVTLSEGVRNNVIDFLGLDGDKVKTIYNMCDRDRLFDGRIKADCALELLQKLKNKYCIFSCGSLGYQKGQWHLIKVFKQVNNVYPETRLVLLGEGDYRSNIENLIKAMDLEDKVILPGYIRGFHTLMKDFGKIFCFTSIYEGFGNVLLEAMACDNAVVSADCKYGPGEILSGESRQHNEYSLTEYGILTPAFPYMPADFSEVITEEENIMAKAIIYLIEHEEVRKQIIGNSRSRLNEFEPKRIIEQWELLMAEIGGQ